MDLAADGKEVKIIFEGASVKLVSVFEEENNPLYKKAKNLGLIAGVCLACSKVMGVYEQNKNTGLSMLKDMNGHAGMKSYIKIDNGYFAVFFFRKGSFSYNICYVRLDNPLIFQRYHNYV